MSKILASRLVTVDEFIRYLVAKNVGSICPSCAHDSAFVSADTDGINAAQTRSDVVKFNLGTMGISATPYNTILSLSTLCDNCGYIRSFAAQNVYDWLDKQKQDGTSA